MTKKKQPVTGHRKRELFYIPAIFISAVILLLAVRFFFLLPPVLAIPEKLTAAVTGTNASTDLFRAVSGFKIITFDENESYDEIMNRADFMLCPLDGRILNLQVRGLLDPIALEDRDKSQFPPVLLDGVSGLLPGSPPKTVPVLPVTADPSIILWRSDWTGGVDGDVPRFFDELVGKNGAPAVTHLFSLAGGDRKELLSWLCYMESRDLRESSDLFSPEAATRAVADFSALAGNGWFQQGAFSYGADDALVLLMQGKAKAALLRLSRYYALPIGERAGLKVGGLPTLRSAKRLATIADLQVVCKTRRVRTWYDERAASSALSGTEFQAAIAQRLGTLPANSGGPDRDLSSRTAEQRMFSSSVLLVPSLTKMTTAVEAEAVDAMTRSLREAAMVRR